MSVRSSSSSSGAGASPVPPVTVPVTSSGSLKQLQPYGYDSCTYTKTKDTKNLYGCYLFRSCQSCLETDGCMINDLGICVSQSQGMRNLDADSYQYSTSYYSEMNYLKAIGKNLSLPKAQTDNKDALAAEQNWHFRAGEATYCKADDAVCKECKASNFWRGNDTNTLPDSRFCVGTNNCVCIQTCEVPTFKSPGCQWKLSAPPSPSPYYGYYNNGYDRTEVTHLAYWEWLLVVLVIIVVHLLFRACSGSKASQLEAARQEAVRAVRRELGIPEDEPVTAPARSAPVLRPLRRTATEATDESSVHEGDAQEVKTPRHGAENSVTDSQTVFVEIDDARATPSTQPPVPSTRTEV